MLYEFERTTESSLERKWDGYFKRLSPTILKLKVPKCSKVEILETKIEKLGDSNIESKYFFFLLP